MNEAEVLAKAQTLGYDADRYPQDDPRWKSPEQFLTFGEELNPILRENNKRLEQANKELEARIEKIQIEVAKFAKVHEETSKTAYAKALADLKAEKKTAYEEQDYDKVVELDDKIEETKEAAKKEEAKPEAKTETPAVDPEAQKVYSEWASRKDNQWIKNTEAEAYALAIGQVMAKQGVSHTGKNFKPFLEEVTERVKGRFPELFEGTKREDAARVEGGGDGGSFIAKSKHTYVNLPQEAKEACDLLITTIPNYTKEKYCAAYKW